MTMVLQTNQSLGNLIPDWAAYYVANVAIIVNMGTQ